MTGTTRLPRDVEVEADAIGSSDGDCSPSRSATPAASQAQAPDA
jgi:hypothetical protein